MGQKILSERNRLDSSESFLGFVVTVVFCWLSSFFLKLKDYCE